MGIHKGIWGVGGSEEEIPINDAGFLYKCVDTNTWVRLAAMTSW